MAGCLPTKLIEQWQSGFASGYREAPFRDNRSQLFETTPVIEVEIFVSITLC